MAASMHTPEVDNSIPYALHVHACSNAYYIYIYFNVSNACAPNNAQKHIGHCMYKFGY